MPDPTAGAEQGLLSIAFPADYATSGLFYVYFTNNDGDVEVDVPRSAGDPPAADPASRRPVIVIPHGTRRTTTAASSSSAPGALALFRHRRRGAGQRANAPDLDSLLGKLIRINPLPADGGQPYRSRTRTRSWAPRAGTRSSPTGCGTLGGLPSTPGGSRSATSAWRPRRRSTFYGSRDARGANFGWPEYEGDVLYDPRLPGRRPADLPDPHL